MEFIRSIFSPRKAAVSSVAGEVIRVPYLGDMNQMRSMPVPDSGYARAEWYANGAPYADVRTDYIASSTGNMNRIGANQRGIDGALRGAEWNDGFYTGYITATYPEAASREADVLGSFWDTQVSSSAGLNVPGNDQVYVTVDTSSVWA